MKKLFLVGCSVSDNLPVKQVYGNLLAKKIGYEYVHMAKGIGSNYRMWRYATKAVLEKKITSDDLLLVQYSGVERTEFWSEIDRTKPVAHDDISEVYPKGGTILKFKMDAHEWQDHEIEKSFFKLYQEKFLNPVFEEEKFRVHNYNFQCMLAQNNIKALFFQSRAVCSNIENFQVIERYAPYFYKETHEFMTDKSIVVDPVTDRFHLNPAGHEKLAGLLYSHILATNLPL